MTLEGPPLLLATSNLGKVSELKALLIGVSFSLVTLQEVGIIREVEETGSTMEENALLKARGYACISGLRALADDSGLEVDALDGAPGVHSRRYIGADRSDQDRVKWLLSELEGIPLERRSARFRSVIAIVSPEGYTQVCEGVCEGIIAFAPSGEAGFGYDPVFLIPELGRTMAELSQEEKNQVSHRGAAARCAVRVLETLAKESNL